jgi:DNA-binding transcriptional regulator LsrR (DeoR family)
MSLMNKRKTKQASRTRKGPADRSLASVRAREHAFLFCASWQDWLRLETTDLPPSQDQIALKLGIDPPQFSKNIRLARKSGWLAHVFVRPPAMDDGEWRACQEHIQDFRLAAEVMSSMKALHPPRQIHVIRAAGGSASNDGRRIFASRAASIVLPILASKEAHTVAVGWGNLMKDLAYDGMGPLCGVRTPRTKRPLDIFPVRGEPYSASVDVSPTSIAMALGRFINGGTKRVRSLAGIPAIIPGSLEGQEVTAVHRMLRQIPVYREVFGSVDAEDRLIEPGLADKMTTLLASFGPQEPSSLWTQECMSIAGFERFQHLMEGDLAGVPVPRENVDMESLAKHSRRLVGLSSRHVEQCARKSWENENYNIILLGMGSNRASCLRRICQLGWASVIIVDTDLAKAMLKESK